MHINFRDCHLLELHDAIKADGVIYRRRETYQQNKNAKPLSGLMYIAFEVAKFVNNYPEEATHICMVLLSSSNSDLRIKGLEILKGDWVVQKFVDAGKIADIQKILAKMTDNEINELLKVKGVKEALQAGIALDESRGSFERSTAYIAMELSPN